MAALEQGSDLVVTAQEGSDAWRLTSYGFVHDSEHALVAPFPIDTAMEVEFTADFSAQFDQAGIFVRVSAERWVKAGVEFTDGLPFVGAVVTDQSVRLVLGPRARVGGASGARPGQPEWRRAHRPGPTRRVARSSWSAWSRSSRTWWPARARFSVLRRAPGSPSRSTPGAGPNATTSCTDRARPGSSRRS